MWPNFPSTMALFGDWYNHAVFVLSTAVLRHRARLCQTVLTADSAARRYLTDAIFPYYIVHQTAIILIAYELRPSDLPAWLEARTVISGTVATCALTYEIVRRIGVLRPLFGLKAEPAARPSVQPA